MEEIVMGIMGLVTGALNWGIANALPLAVGALLGSELAGAALGLVSDMLSRAQGLIQGVSARVGGKK